MDNGASELIDLQLTSLETLIDAMEVLERGVETRCDDLVGLIAGTDAVDAETLTRAEQLFRRSAARKPAGAAAYCVVRKLRCFGL